MAKAPQKLSPAQTFGENVRLARLSKSIAQDELCDLAGVGRAYMTGVEAGTRNITINNMTRIADALDIPLHRLLDPEVLETVRAFYAKPSKK